jgi:hypothetical protein
MTLRKSIRNYIMTILVINEIKKQFFSTIKEYEGQYRVHTNALAKVPITSSNTFRLLPFIHKKNRVSLDSHSGIIVFMVLFINRIINLTARVAGICMKDE